jgi:hypothetical protein
MAQYWIQIPVENAKEVVQRKIDELSAAGTITGYDGLTVNYNENCEVVFDGNYLFNNTIEDLNTIYFGTWVANLDNNFGAILSIKSDDGNNYTILDWLSFPPLSGNYPYVIWNLFYNDAFDGSQGYFFGYKFTLTAP